LLLHLPHIGSIERRVPPPHAIAKGLTYGMSLKRDYLNFRSAALAQPCAQREHVPPKVGTGFAKEGYAACMSPVTKSDIAAIVTAVNWLILCAGEMAVRDHLVWIEPTSDTVIYSSDDEAEQAKAS
jgi:hypothetical protein